MTKVEDITLSLNEDKRLFEFELEEGKKGIIKYVPAGRKLKLIHTQVPSEVRGKGYGTEMVKKTLEEIDERVLKVIPLCPFISDYMDEHPEWDHLRYKTTGSIMAGH